MIDIDDLRLLQVKFESVRSDYEEEYKELEKLRKQFIRKFPIEKIKAMTKKDYAIGFGAANESFCYWLEVKLMELGKMKGSYSGKMFGFYYSVENGNYIALKKFQKEGTIEDAFENIKKQIYDLLIAGKNNNIDFIRKSDISPMFKGKILTTYFPDLYLNIFSGDHLDHFLDSLLLYYPEKLDIVDKRIMLLDFKKNDTVMKHWNNHLFMKFLYFSFGYPAIKKNNIQHELHDYLGLAVEYPDLKDVKPTTIELEIVSGKEIVIKSSKSQTKKIDFERENRIKHKLGKRGEEIVLKYEKNFLENNGREDLARKVNWVSTTDDSLGYDILSYDLDGKKKYIEVKATTSSYTTKIQFYISNNQFEIAKNLENYHFYIVFKAKEKNPEIWQLKNPMQFLNNGLILTPTKYNVKINTRNVE